MNPVEAALRRIAEDLGAAGGRWALIGGLAVSVRAEPRTTRDVDVCVQVRDDTEAEAIVYALQARGYRILSVLEQSSAGRLATVRLEPPSEAGRGALVDLLFASSGIETEIVDAAEPLAILADLEAPVARVGHLIALKVLARDDRRRPQDWDDIQALLKESTPTDLEEARSALQLIEERGYHRSKNLVQHLDEILGDGAPGRP
ncbi:nucleotidyl transferase AbiEii/AbiGii toxin family protein [Sorangium sp. So ce131]|uniref:nucleotidyl transferase AbiEii/AbiGii toxin family protein n=1 Tax=Sorangium sp. So ce131 TaxID=3133282 RepID=UPI003F647F94